MTWTARVVAFALFLFSRGVPSGAQDSAAPAGEGTEAVVFAPGSTGVSYAEAEAHSGAGAPPFNPYAGDLFTRYRLTGDWLGARSGLAASGLTFDVFHTQFEQGVASGGQRRKFAYGGKLDYLFNVDSGKLGLWPGGFLNLHAETRYGQDVNEVDGLLTPSNIAMFFPEPERNITSITGLKFSQALTERAVVYLGKINSLDEYGFRFAPGLGTNRPGLAGFMNTSLVFNPIVARTVPYSTAAVGFAVLSEAEPLLALTIFDPEERAAGGLEDLFARGAVLVPDLTVQVRPLGRPGKYNLGGSWSSASYRTLDPAAYLAIPPELIKDERFAPQVRGSWSLYTNFYQALWVDEENEKRTWGVFGQFGISDGDPNPIRFVANGGVGGRSMLPGRTVDTFGVGYFYLGLSQNFKALARPFLPQRDEYGVELFYNLAITPWARLTADLQVARPSTVGLDTVIIPGLRFQVLF